MSNTTSKVELSIAEAFDLPIDKDITVPGMSAPSAFTPEKDNGYQFRSEVLSDILAWLKLSEESGDGLFLSGPTGSGKSSIVNQIAARLNYSVQRVTAHSRMEMPELIGHHIVMDGDLIWQDGPLVTAMRYGHLFLLDELDLLDPATAAGLNSILEGAPLVLAENGGELVVPHEDFRFIATGNTNGGGDRTGLFQGTMQQNAAFMDRFWVILVDYPSKEMEKKILAAKCPEVHWSIADKMIEVANEIRSLFTGENGEVGSIEVTCSTRTLVRWASMSWFFQSKSAQGINPIAYALERALSNRASPETKAALSELVQRHFAK